MQKRRSKTHKRKQQRALLKSSGKSLKIEQQRQVGSTDSKVVR